MGNIRRVEQEPRQATAWREGGRKVPSQRSGRRMTGSAEGLRNRIIAVENELILLRNEMARRFGTEDT